MENNDILIRLRYALDIKDADMINVFKLGGVTVTREELQKMLTKPKDFGAVDSAQEKPAVEDVNQCDNHTLESFLNGFIIFKRGKQESKPGESEKQAFMIKDSRTVNNVFLKKVKIALSLTSEDMLDIFKSAGVDLSNSELSALLRREGQRNYRECGDRYARYFLKGLAARYRER
ncbi:MAG: DUF1456 family protein [Lacrimispora sp.]|uniref:DUF1456 family protein n=1 Tax=Lacrimispora sp. TaxID=2719234 RepID=UPI0039E5C5E9